MTDPLLLVGAYCSALFCFLVVSFVKAAYHLKYLKKVLPEEYEKYKTYCSVFTLGGYDVKMQLLIFPFFKRYFNEENVTTKPIAKKVRFYQCLSLLFLIVLLAPIIIGIFH